MFINKKNKKILPKENNRSDLNSMLGLLVKKIKEKSRIESKIEFAKIMKEKGYKINEISAITGLSINEIELL